MYFFTARDGTQIYMGKDKYENEHLIKHGWPEDVWFHVDNLSSAHVYLRLKRGPNRKKYLETGLLDHIPEALEDCLQLVKANSIEGSKKSAVAIVYTPWENLKKTGGMADGQVGFHDQRKVVTVRTVEKNREVLNRINKTKEECFPDLAAAREERDAKVRAIQKKKFKLKMQKEKEEIERLRAEKEARDYSHFMDESAMRSNADAADDDFM